MSQDLDGIWADNDFVDDNDDEFNEDGAGWYHSDENISGTQANDADDNDNDGWSDIDIDIDINPEDDDDVTEIENEFWMAYYERSDMNVTLQSFLRVVELIENGAKDTDDFKFKALTEIVILYINQHNDRQKTVEYFKAFLVSSRIAKCNDINRNIRKILNTVKPKHKRVNSVYNTLYDLCMKEFEATSGSRKHLWFRLGVERCRDYLDENMLGKCQIWIDKLHSTLDKTETAKLLQVYAVKIQLIMRLIDDLAIAVNKDANEYDALQLSLRELMDETQRIMASSVDINDNESMSIIYECLAQVFASNNDWSKSYDYFQKAFLFYQEIAHQNTTKCLKYLLISYMILSDRQVMNPFDMKEVKVFEHHHEILSMNQLVNAFENDNIVTFNRLLAEQQQCKDSDPFLLKCLDLAQFRLQGKSLLNLVRSYDRVKVVWLCRKLQMDMNSIEKLIVKLIINNELKGRLDQMHMVLILKEKEDQQHAVLNALQHWFQSVNQLRNVINVRASHKVPQFGARMMEMDYFHHNAYQDLYLVDSAFISWD